jgi:hypothetical protein
VKSIFKLRPIFFVWLGWALIMVGYQLYVRERFQPQRPDYAVSWTPSETRADSQNDKPYLMEPFLNDHVSWDSEYYLSIAVGGYDDPIMRAIPANYTWSRPLVDLKGQRPNWISMNYAFFPLYPLMIRLLAIPLSLFRLNPIATATLAGVVVSMLGALGAMVALYDLARDDEGEAGGRRAAFYLLIFPAAMFLAEVYTEGLFLGLSFGTIALARRRQWVWAALLAAGATWTRAAGGLLLLPMALYWWLDGGLARLVYSFSWREAAKAALVASPVAAYLVWQVTLGPSFHAIETAFFGRGLLVLDRSLAAWKDAYAWMTSGQLQGHAYYLVEFVAILFGFGACLLMFRRDPVLSLYGLLTIFFSLTSGGAQGMHRYVMAAPAVFLLPARLGKNEAFDRVWTLGNILLMGVFAAMFSFDFWAG